jgi:uncharacterized membrane protein (UPF0127 family)
MKVEALVGLVALALSVLLIGGCATSKKVVGKSSGSSTTLTTVSEAGDAYRWLDSELVITAGAGQAVVEGAPRQVDCVKVLKPSQFTTGLMGNTPAQHGAYFGFGSQVRYGFWMKDTAGTLVVYWLDQHGKVLGHAVMAADTTTGHYPPSSYRAAVELPAALAPGGGFNSMVLGRSCEP